MMPTKKIKFNGVGLLFITMAVAAVFLLLPGEQGAWADYRYILFDFDNTYQPDNYFGTGKESGSGFDWSVGVPTSTYCSTSATGFDPNCQWDAGEGEWVDCNVYGLNPTGDVTDEQCSWIQTPPVGLGGGQDVEIVLRHCFQLEDATDAANVWISCITTMAEHVSPSDFFQGPNKHQLYFDDYTSVAPSNPCPWLNGHPSWGYPNQGFTNSSPGHGGNAYTNDIVMLTSASNPYGSTWSNENMVCIYRFVYGQHDKTTKRQGAAGWYFVEQQIDRGSPTAVVLLYFESTGLNGRVVIDWETASELHTIGFNLYRSLDESGPFTQKINERIIPAVGSSMFGASYSFTDQDVINGVPYFYMLEEVDYQGYTTRYGPVAATPEVESPTLLSPADGAVLTVEIPGIFEWNGAFFSQFKLQMAADPDFPVDGRVSVPDNGSWTSEEILALSDKTWDEVLLMAVTSGSDRIFWRVAAKDDLDEIFFSETWSFTLGMMESMSDDSSDPFWKRLLLLITK